MKNEATIGFVQEHREEDVRKLALQARRDSDVDLPWALDQIQGWQTARRKLPSWAAIDGIVYPPHLSMEQCSSQQTALYKCSILDRLPEGSHETLVDLTGGFGVDFAFMAQRAQRAVYVERQEHLCETARHNFGLLVKSRGFQIHCNKIWHLQHTNTSHSYYFKAGKLGTSFSSSFAPFAIFTVSLGERHAEPKRNGTRLPASGSCRPFSG